MKWINLVHDKDQWFVHIKRVRFFYLFFIYTWTTYSFSRCLRLCEGHPLALHPAVVDRWLLINVVFRVGIGLPNPPLITSTALCVCVCVCVCVCECEWEVQQGRTSAEMTNLRLFEGTSSTCLMLQECSPPYRFPSKLPSHVVHGLVVWTSSSGIPLFINTHIWTGNARRFWRA